MVRVYKNLHKTRSLSTPIYSVQTKRTNGWRVNYYASRVVLREVTFVVQEAARLRSLATGQKVVHAFVCGQPVNHLIVNHKNGVPVTYDMKVGIFKVRATGQAVTRCEYAVIADKGVIAFGIN